MYIKILHVTYMPANRMQLNTSVINLNMIWMIWYYKSVATVSIVVAIHPVTQAERCSVLYMVSKWNLLAFWTYLGKQTFDLLWNSAYRYLNDTTTKISFFSHISTEIWIYVTFFCWKSNYTLGLRSQFTELIYWKCFA